MRGRGGLVAAALGALLFLAGCLGPTGGGPEPTLAISADAGTPTVVARVLHAQGSLFRWMWGDGTVSETTTPAASHTYAALDVYVITVEVYETVTGGDGGPGPGTSPTTRLTHTLTAIVDLRPAIALVDIYVTVISPPPWYDPARWPRDCYPAACDLRLTAVFQYNRQDAPRPVRAVWTVFREDTFVYQAEGDPVILPAEVFLGRSCQGSSRVPYRIRLVVFLSNGTLLEFAKTIYACPPTGC